MDAAPPDPLLVRRLATLVEFSLLGPEQLVPWADEWVMKLESPPLWLLDLCTAGSAEEVGHAFGQHAHDFPAQASDFAESDDNDVACLFLCYRRKDFSWMDFLEKAMRRLDQDRSERRCHAVYLLWFAFKESTDRAQLEQTQQVLIEREFHDGLARMEDLIRAFTR